MSENRGSHLKAHAEVGLRLKLEALEVRHHTYCYQGKPFNGIAFATSDGRVTDAHYIQNGIKQGSYAGDYVKALPGVMRLTSEYEGLEGDPESEVTLNGVPYDGLLYGFENMFCTSESRFENGQQSGITAAWHKSGLLRAYDNFYRGSGEACTWHINSKLHEIYIVKKRGIFLSASFVEDGSMDVLKITEEYFETPGSGKKDLPFQTISEAIDLTYFRVAPEIFLSKQGITSQVFGLFTSMPGFGRIEVFKAFDTSLRDEDLAVVGNLPYIRLIDVDDMTGVHARVMQEIKRKRPMIDVQYNAISIR